MARCWQYRDCRGGPLGGGQTQLGPVDPLQDELAASLGKCTQEERKKKNKNQQIKTNKPTKTREQKEQESAEGTPRSQ